MTRSPRRFPDLPTSLPPNLQSVLGLSPSAMTLGLGNIQALLDRLDHPEKAYPTIVVAGTNGKGSVTAMLASILTGSGMKVGRYTSPHVYSVTERISVCDQPVDIEEMERAAERVAVLHSEIGFSYFEALTAIAFLIFAQQAVDVAVMETGLGGRFDSTNVTTPAVSVITSIAVDHRRILGDSTGEILREKLGITRPNVPLLVGDLPADLMASVRDRAQRDDFPVVAVKELAQASVEEHALGHTRIRLKTAAADYGEVVIPFGGAHQVTNAVLAVGAAEHFLGGPVAVAGGLAEAYLPGRCEVIEDGRRRFVLDVAHNDQALTAAIEQLPLSGVPRDELALVLGLMRRKELFEFPSLITPAVKRMYMIEPAHGDAYAPAELLERFVVKQLHDATCDVILWNRPSPGGDYWARLLDTLRRPENPARVVLVTGSHHIVESFGRALMRKGIAV